MSYGLEVYASNGTKILDGSSRVTRSVTSGTTATINTGNSLNVSVTDFANDDTWKVFTSANNRPNSFNVRLQDVTKHSGYFKITNNMGVNSSFDYIVVRSG